jgi:tetratricopeptide (TPR) repeat protein
MIRSVRILMTVAALSVAAQAFALDLDKVKVPFLQGDYRAAIKEGEDLMENAQDVPELSELYYLLGTSYMKEGNLLRACDIYDILLDEFPQSTFHNDALLGKADTCYLRGYFTQALGLYQELMATDMGKTYPDLLHYRISLTYAKLGDMPKALESRKAITDKTLLQGTSDLGPDTCPLPGGFYTIQVGVFAKKANAVKLNNELLKKRIAAYLEDDTTGSEPRFRVRVGRFLTRAEAEEMSKKLETMGYPVRVCP